LQYPTKRKKRKETKQKKRTTKTRNVFKAQPQSTKAKSVCVYVVRVRGREARDKGRVRKAKVRNDE